MTGVDSAVAMIGLCRGRLPCETWVVADMRGLSLGACFDGVLAWDSFVHLSPGDQRGMFAVFREHARPGAPLLFTSRPRHGEALGRFRGEVLYHASLDPAEYRTLLAAHGFRVVRHRAEDPEAHGRTVWLARAV